MTSDPATGTLPPLETREAVRARELAAIPRWYHPLAHLSVTSVFGLAVVAAALALLSAVSFWELLFVPAFFLLANAIEWHAHRDLLHHRSRLAPVLYDRHTPVHHVVYVHDDMVMRSFREARLVLIPAYGILLIFLTTAPLTALLWALGQRNLGLLFLAVSVGYVVLYEWLHLAYHLPPSHPVARLPGLKALAHHHRVHHDPRLMQRYNFNVTFPLWDRVRGTVHP